MIDERHGGPCVTRRGLLRAGLGLARFGLAGLGACDMLGPGFSVAMAAGVTAQLATGGSIYYGGYFTTDFSVDGAPAFCANPSKKTPPSGSYEVRDYMDGCRIDYSQPQPTHYEDVQRPQVATILYYGWGGPGFDWSLWPSTWYDGTPMTRERIMACEHVLLSDTFALEFDAAVYGCDAACVAWIRNWVTGISEDVTHVPNWENTVRAHMEARLGTVPDSFDVYQLYCGEGYQRILTFSVAGAANLEKKSSHADWL